MIHVFVGLLSLQGTLGEKEGQLVDVEVQLRPSDVETRTFTIEVYRDWAPKGAGRFVELVSEGFYDGCAFFRVIGNFMSQFGINGNSTRQAEWRRRSIFDDEGGKASNGRGTMTFAHAGKNTRSTQIFINFKDNKFLDSQNFPPFGKIISGMDVVDQLHITGEGAPGGPGPNQGKIQQRGDAYLRSEFPDLSRIVTARLRTSRPVSPRRVQATDTSENDVVEITSRSPPASGLIWAIQWLFFFIGATFAVGACLCPCFCALVKKRKKSTSPPKRTTSFINDVESTLSIPIALEKEN